MVRKLDYRWHLRQVMAARGMFATTDLLPLLAERGICLSSSQVYRLVVERPERLSLRVLMALLDIFECEMEDLIEPVAGAKPARKARTASGEEAGVGGLRPTGARITRAGGCTCARCSAAARLVLRGLRPPAPGVLVLRPDPGRRHHGPAGKAALQPVSRPRWPGSLGGPHTGDHPAGAVVASASHHRSCPPDGLQASQAAATGLGHRGHTGAADR
jgi:hypothetical protein